MSGKNKGNDFYHKNQALNPMHGLIELAREVSLCRRCKLQEAASQVVFGEGDEHARLMFVGEGPGAEEDRQGRPFVGKAGQLLDRILHAVHLEREDVYIANIIKCRPPGNRLPAGDEVEACLPYLQRQIEIVDPIIIVCLGSLATKTLVDPKSFITKVRGQWYKKEKRHIMPTFHPAALLRDPAKKKLVWQDMQQVEALYKELCLI